MGAAYHIHVKLGPDLLESVYESVLAYELKKRGLDVVRQQPIPVVYDELQFDEGFRTDLIVNDRVIVKLKSVEKIYPVHKKQFPAAFKRPFVRANACCYGLNRIRRAAD